MSDSVRAFETGQVRLSYAAAILHTIDLDGLERVHERLVSPQALVDGIPFAMQNRAENWLEIIQAAQVLRNATSFDSEVLDLLDSNLPAQLQEPASARYERGDEQVSEALACPSCGERGVDDLQLNDDDSARCLSCGHRYRLPRN